MRGGDRVDSAAWRDVLRPVFHFFKSKLVILSDLPLFPVTVNLAPARPQRFSSSLQAEPRLVSVVGAALSVRGLGVGVGTVTPEGPDNVSALIINGVVDVKVVWLIVGLPPSPWRLCTRSTGWASASASPLLSKTSPWQ